MERRSPRADSLLILGLGNVLCSDDGLGVAAVELLRRTYDLPPEVRALDGGTLGMTLLGHFEGVRDVILVDAIQADGPAGTQVLLDGEEVAPAVRERLSCHQIGVADLLDGLRLLGSYPRRLLLVGMVPETIELGLGRTPAVDDGLPELVGRVVEAAAGLGYELKPKPRDVEAPAIDRRAAAHALEL